MTKQSLSLHKCSQQVSVTCPNFTYKTRFDLNKTYKTHVPKTKEKPSGLYLDKFLIQIPSKSGLLDESGFAYILT